MAAIESLYKFASAELGALILNTGKLRWSSPELFDEPWAIKLDPKLGFDHVVVCKTMLKVAVSMIFTREMPNGNQEHPLYKAIKRWRLEDRFKDEVEAYDALSELLAPTGDTFKEKLNHIVTGWKVQVANSRILCLSENIKDTQSWKLYGDNHRGLALKFETGRSTKIKDPRRVDYIAQRCRLTTVEEQVNDLVGIKRASVQANFENKLLTKNKCEASEKEWRCIRNLQEEELDCGEEPEDWYIDEPFNPKELQAVYFGFQMPEEQRQGIIKVLQKNYSSVPVFAACPSIDQYELDFQKLTK